MGLAALSCRPWIVPSGRMALVVMAVAEPVVDCKLPRAGPPP